MNPERRSDYLDAAIHAVQAGKKNREWIEGHVEPEAYDRTVSALKHFANMPPQLLAKYPKRWRDWVFTLMTNGMMEFDGREVAVTVKGYEYLKTMNGRD